MVLDIDQLWERANEMAMEYGCYPDPIAEVSPHYFLQVGDARFKGCSYALKEGERWILPIPHFTLITNQQRYADFLVHFFRNRGYLWIKLLRTATYEKSKRVQSQQRRRREELRLAIKDSSVKPLPERRRKRLGA